MSTSLTTLLPLPLLLLTPLASANPLPWNLPSFFNWDQYAPAAVAPNYVPSNPTPAPYVSGPELTTNFPDPCIITVNGTYYSFATGSGTANIPMAMSTDFVNWVLVTEEDGSERDTLPIVPEWVNMTSPNTWAPVSTCHDLGIAGESSPCYELRQLIIYLSGC